MLFKDTNLLSSFRSCFVHELLMLVKIWMRLDEDDVA